MNGSLSQPGGEDRRWLDRRVDMEDETETKEFQECGEADDLRRKGVNRKTLKDLRPQKIECQGFRIPGTRSQRYVGLVFRERLNLSRYFHFRMRFT